MKRAKALLTWFLNLISGDQFGDGTEDDFRNPFWRFTEKLRFEVDWTLCLFDLRTGYFKSDKTLRSANFYNGFLTFNLTLIKAKRPSWLILPRFNLVLRFVHPWWIAWGWGPLWDRGELGFTGPWVYGFRSQNEHNPGGVIASDHEEGVV